MTVFRSVTANLGTWTHLSWVCWVILNSKTNSGYPTPQIKEEMFTTTPDVWAQTSAVNQCRDFGVAICKDENAWLWIWMSLLRGNPNLIRWLAIVNRDIWSCQTGVITHMTTRYKQRPLQAVELVSNAAKFQLYTSACTWCHLSTGERLSHAHLNWNTRAPTCFTCNQNCDVSQMKCKEFQCLGLNLKGGISSQWDISK